MLLRETPHAAGALPDYLIVWRNPGSTNNHRTTRIIEDLRQAKLFKDILVIETEHRQHARNQKRLLDTLEKVQGKAWVAIAGGDGTIGAVINALQSDTTTHMPPLLPLPAGNSNDIATMLHRTRSITPARLKRSRQLPVYPLECTLTDSAGKTDTRYAMAYVSFGITAHTAQTINAPSHRGQHTARTSHRINRRLHEIHRFANVLQRATPFTIKESGESRVLFERIITNGQRMAKYFRWPVSLTDAVFHDIIVNQLGPARTLKDIIMMTRGKIGGERKTGDSVISFTCITPVLAQLDGETLEIKAGTKVSVTHADQPIEFISLR